MQLKAGQQLLLLNAVEEVASALRQEGFTFTGTDEAPSIGTYAAVVVFVEKVAELERLAPEAVAVLQPQGLLWVAYPKKTSGIKTDLTRDHGWQAMQRMQFGPVRQVALSEAWSALRFKHAEERKEPTKFGVDQPGIDRVAKTVALPDDLREALQHADLLQAFEGMAFTHRKEYVLAVLEAKKPETRARRIAKAVEAAGKKKV
ncbi:YdeI/OmpD-associated family protein [Pontibacter mangrovi]|uniref:YdeI/OmpD-associated family protein n=1 Tax=Pontibacter mangrovi TaxID=2589816 RepID=UPI001EEFA894|nr:YdeI/OmpD-associated family protein [Pontibacter mangrovi]